MDCAVTFSSLLYQQLLGRFRGERHKLNGIKILYGTQTGTAKVWYRNVIKRNLHGGFDKGEKFLLSSYADEFHFLPNATYFFQRLVNYTNSYPQNMYTHKKNYW